MHHAPPSDSAVRDMPQSCTVIGRRHGATTLIFHLALVDDWAETTRTGTYTVSTRGRTLVEEGFIHCSTVEQIEATANRFYGDLEQLVVLAIDVDGLNAEVKWEPPAPGTDELFPHVYGPIPLDAVSRATVWYRPGDRWVLDQLDP